MEPIETVLNRLYKHYNERVQSTQANGIIDAARIWQAKADAVSAVAMNLNIRLCKISYPAAILSPTERKRLTEKEQIL